MKKILGMGNALTDILLQIDKDEVLYSLNLLKGGMQLINTERSEEISAAVINYEKKMGWGIHGMVFRLNPRHHPCI